MRNRRQLEQCTCVISFILSSPLMRYSVRRASEKRHAGETFMVLLIHAKESEQWAEFRLTHDNDETFRNINFQK